MKKLSTKSVLLFASVMALSAFAMPAISSASTPVPGLLTGDTQVFVANTAGTKVAGSVTLNGALTLTGAATISCSGNTFGVSWTTAGTTTVNSFSTSGCAVASFPSCGVTVAPTPGSLPWGDRFYTTDGVASSPFRDYMNISFDVILHAGTPTCPAPASAYTYTPTGGANGLHPAVSTSGDTITATFGTGSGSTANAALGSLTFSGSLLGTTSTDLRFTR
jgi:hypothetical protein